jgi:Zn-dependent M28 family amino/carboxypeptidase
MIARAGICRLPYDTEISPMHNKFFSAALAGLVLSVSVPAADISGDRIRAHVKFLASDLLEGRGVGSRGGQLAEDYIAAYLAASGLKPAGEKGTYFQKVPMLGVKVSPDSTLQAVKGSQTLNFAFQQDFVGTTHRQTPDETFDAELVFVGHGIVAPEENWNDYKTSVKGKIVVVFTNEPQPDNPEVFKGRTLTYKGRWTYKFEEATRQGALGCVIVHTTSTAGYGWEVVRNSWGKEDPQMKLEPGQYALGFAGWVTQEAGEKLFQMSGHSVAELMKAADSRDFQPIPLGINLKGHVVAKLRPIESRNVAGIIEGSDPAQRSELVIFTAHWDHLGVGLAINGDDIYNGAVDNATGCGVVLEIARAWAELNQKPKRSALFLFVTAEESGLRGSEYYGQHPLFPTNKTAIDLNYDALFPLAPSKDVVVTGAERTTAYPIVEATAKRYGLEIKPDPRPEQGSFYRSDHFSLARVGIPAFTISTRGTIPGKPPEHAQKYFSEFNTKHYHQPSDEYHDDWDFSGMELAARFGFTLGLDAANAQQMFTWKAGDEFLGPRVQSGVR